MQEEAERLFDNVEIVDDFGSLVIIFDVSVSVINSENKCSCSIFRRLSKCVCSCIAILHKARNTVTTAQIRDDHSYWGEDIVEPPESSQEPEYLETVDVSNALAVPSAEVEVKSADYAESSKARIERLFNWSRSEAFEDSPQLRSVLDQVELVTLGRYKCISKQKKLRVLHEYRRTIKAKKRAEHNYGAVSTISRKKIPKVSGNFSIQFVPKKGSMRMKAKARQPSMKALLQE